MDIKIQSVPCLWCFPGVSISRYIFPGGKFTVTFVMVWETEYLFFRIQLLFFSEGSNWLRFNWATPEKIQTEQIDMEF